MLRDHSFHEMKEYEKKHSFSTSKKKVSSFFGPLSIVCNRVVVLICVIIIFVQLEVRFLLNDLPNLSNNVANIRRNIIPESFYFVTDELDDNSTVSYDIYQDDTVGNRIAVTSPLREKPVIFDIYRDAMYSLSGEVELHGLDDEYSVEQSHILTMYEGNKKLMKKYRPTPFISSSSTQYDISIITQTSYERLFYFPHLLQRWKGPISAVLFLKDDEMRYFNRFIRNTPLSNRLRLTLYEVLPMEQSTHQCVVYYTELSPVPPNATFYDSTIVYGNLNEEGLRRRFKRICNDNSEPIYPINRLRNIAINTIDTTHFLVVDMDMWPIETAYHDLVNLPTSILQNEHVALILPAFSLKSSIIRDCSSFQDCVEKTIKLIPRNKTELKQCIYTDLCSTFRPDTNTHNYLSDDWYDLPLSTRFVFKQCFNHVFQEPYVMVRRSPHLPLFDERFINYGYNKVQWIEHLRWIGYQFGVIAQSFAVDIPHPPSNYANSWNKLWEVRNNPNITMRVVYRKFLTELRSRTNDDSTVFVCHRYANRFTKNIAVNHQDMKDRRIRVDEAKKRMKKAEEEEMMKTLKKEEEVFMKSMEEEEMDASKSTKGKRKVIKGGIVDSNRRKRIIFKSLSDS